MPAVQILRNGQITLPAQIRQALNVKEGDYLEIKIKNGLIYLTPKKLVNKVKKNK